MIQTGFILIEKSSNTEIGRWVQDLPPNPLYLPNGDQVCGVNTQWQDETYRLDPLMDNPAPPPPAPTFSPMEISDRQFFQQLAVVGLITQAEALAAVKTGDIPTAMATLVSALPSNQQFTVQMLLSGATVFRRDNPFVDALGSAYGMSSAQIDDIWKAAALL